jgi:hypothetical protein
MKVEKVSVVAVGENYYEGVYEIEPTNERQILPTKHKVLEQDLVINPIPERYGLVTYDDRKIITIT